MRRLETIICLIAMATAIFAGKTWANGPTETIDPDRLANLVRQDCGSCHGLTLKGGLGRPLTVSHMRLLDEDTIRKIVLDGIPGTAMPGWRGLLSAKDAEWIARALREGEFE